MNSKKLAGKIGVIANQNIKEKEYWLRKLSGELVRTSLPYNHRKYEHLGALNKPGTFEVIRFSLNNELFSRLIKLSSGSDPRLHMVLVAGIETLLYKYSGNKNIIVGTSVYKQGIKDDFINTVLPLRNQFWGDMPFKELLLQVRTSIFEADENQDYPIELLLDQLNMPSPGDGGFPLFDVVILLENIHDKRYIRHINPNIILSFSRTGESIDGELEYNSLMFDKVMVKKAIDHFIKLIKQVLDNINLRLSDIDILLEE